VKEKKLKGMDLGGTGGKSQIVIGHKRSRLGRNVGNLVQKSRFVPILKDTRGNPENAPSERGRMERKTRTQRYLARIKAKRKPKKIHRGDIKDDADDDSER